MRIIGRILSVLVILIVILALAAGGGAIYTIRKDFPQIDGSIKAAGLQAQVDVIRDKWGVPHIYAQSDHDLFFAQGFVHAQDRFWQMEFSRRIGQGRLSEVLGPSAASQDRYLRTLGMHRAAQAEVAALTKDERDMLQAYADGVNAYLNANKGNLGLEFTLLGANGTKFEPEPWTPLNSLTWIKLMSYDLGGNMDTELLRLQLIQAIGVERTAELLPPTYPAGKPVILPSGRFDGLDVAGLARDAQSVRALTGQMGDGLGSNNWVVAGSHSVTGKPILANDPHLGIQMPSIWYEVDLQCKQVSDTCHYQVAGFSFPGVPLVILGHNARVAWGFTNVGPDVQDLYVEEDSGNAVKFNGQMVPLQVIPEVITVGGKLPADYKPGPTEEDRYDESSGKTTITLKVRVVPHHGPIMSDVDAGMRATGKVLSLRWPTLDAGHTMTSLMLMNRAGNWEEFQLALKDFQAPSQNVVYADVDGHIGWQVPGVIPIRPEGCDGLAPAPGDGSCEWQGFVAQSDLPHSFDPARGWIATANNAPVGPDFKPVIGREWDDGYRAERITQLLSAKDKLSLDDMAAIQFDNVNLFAGELIPELADFAPSDPRSQQALEILRKWDLHAGRDSNGQTIFSSLYVHLLKNLFGEALGKLAPDYYANSAFNRQALKAILADPASFWWKGQRAQVLERTFRDTTDELTGLLGADMAGWTWGKVHTATFANQSLGQSDALGGLLKTLLNRGPFAVEGGAGIVDATGWSPNAPYTVRSLPSMRAIYDLSNLAGSRTTHTTGESGHPYNTHYDDFVNQWANGQYHPQLFERTAVEQNSEGHLILNP